MKQEKFLFIMSTFLRVWRAGAWTRVVALAAICLLSGPTVAARGFDIIPRAGLTMASMSKIDGGYGYSKLAPGASVGVAFEFPSTSYLSFEPGIAFSMQGGRAEGGSDFRMNYLEVPINAKIYLYKGLHLLVGPQVSFKLYEGSDGEKHVENLCRTVDLGVDAGIGYQFEKGFNVTLSYYNGVINALEDVYAISEDQVDEMKKLSSYNRYLRVSIGWRF